MVYNGQSGPIRTAVKKIRRKLEETPDSANAICDKPRLGYWMPGRWGAEGDRLNAASGLSTRYRELDRPLDHDAGYYAAQ